MLIRIQNFVRVVTNGGFTLIDGFIGLVQSATNGAELFGENKDD